MTRIRIALPTHLRHMADVGREVEVDAADPPSIHTALDALEARYPQLRGTIREHGSGDRRAYIRYFAGGIDLSHEAPDQALPASVLAGDDVLRVVGAIAGG